MEARLFSFAALTKNNQMASFQSNPELVCNTEVQNWIQKLELWYERTSQIVGGGLLVTRLVFLTPDSDAESLESFSFY